MRQRNGKSKIAILIFACLNFSEPVFAENGRDSDQQNKEKDTVEHVFMGGTEIQGTLEKPHVVYIVPWNRETIAKQDDIPFERSFKQEILETIDHFRFRRRLNNAVERSKGGEAP